MHKFQVVIPAKLVPDPDPGAGIQCLFDKLNVPRTCGDQVRHDVRTLDSQVKKFNDYLMSVNYFRVLKKEDILFSPDRLFDTIPPRKSISQDLPK